jgi:hypothetical protein
MGTESTTGLVQLVQGHHTEVLAVVTSDGSADEGRIPALDAAGKLDDSILDRTVVSRGAVDAGKTPKFGPDGKLDKTALPEGVGADITVVVSTEELAPGAWVNFDTTTNTVRNASANGREVNGFVREGVAAKAEAHVYTSGRNTAVVGQTLGPVFLATAAGQGTSTPVEGKGLLSQRIGTAITPTCVVFAPQPSVRRAR